MSDAQDREIGKLRKDLQELNSLFIKNDEDLRRKLRDIRIANTAGVTATEFTLANRLGITMDVILSLTSENSRASVEAEITKRISESKTTVDIAKVIAAKLYKEDQDY